MPSHRELGTQRWKDQRKRVLQRDQYICVYCNGEATQVDHVIPRAKGGSHDLDNLVACCATCNSRKGSRSHASFLEVTSTPPVFSSRISPMQSEQPTTSPFKLRPDPIQ
jgi:5-methylcytosine-specific restriction endonuclease McrA